MEHVTSLTARQFADRIAPQQSNTCRALATLLLAQSRRKSVGELPIFEARYSYGANVAGPRIETDRFSTILPPCRKSACTECKKLVSATPRNRPLIFVAEGSCEEYLQYQQRAPTKIRRAPLRFYSKGEVIGLNRLLNEFYLPSKPVRPILGLSARRISSGSLSVFFTTSVSNPGLVQCLESKTGDVLKTYMGPDFEKQEKKVKGGLFDKDHSLFFQLMAGAAEKDPRFAIWRSRLLLVPVEPLVNLLKAGMMRPEVQAFLLAALEDFFISVRNNRSDFLRQMAVFNLLAAENLTAYAKRTAHHLIELIRGEYPGFIPHHPDLGDDFGPASSVLKYMEQLGLHEFLPAPPRLLRPAHLGITAQKFVYYSLERPTVPSPVEDVRSVRSLAQEVHRAWTRIDKEIPTVLDSATWDFFISQGKPEGPPSKKDPISFKAYQRDQSIWRDFGWKPDQGAGPKGATIDSVLHEQKRGFLGSFIRVGIGQQKQPRPTSETARSR